MREMQQIIEREWTHGRGSTVERTYDGFRRLSKLEYARAVAHLWHGCSALMKTQCFVTYSGSNTRELLRQCARGFDN